ncbi:glycosyltransferase family 2 protein [Falsiroseomonas sp. E2-1-a20]|uniref:glycosyltransferase family 2 protein n=1 Tax=Falsiroseomonas sp. E2-1-a20 TaxID=3239300 RepID=UPI003F333CA9
MKLSVGVVVPNYNYARHLPDRLQSISSQTRPVQRLVFLDDASTDDSWAVAEPLLAALACPVDMRRNPRNSGSVLRQWQEGASLLDTDLVWLAEADDSADPSMIARLASLLEDDSDAIFAFCDSMAVGPEGQRLAEDGKDYAAALDDHGLSRDGSFLVKEFLTRFLSPRNLVVSASAVLWRRSALMAALAAVRGEMKLWHCAGDWRVYAEACGGAGRVIYLATPLNLHRRHAASVTGSVPAARRFAEVVAMLVFLRRRVGATLERDTVMRDHLATLRRHWGLDTLTDQG